MISVMYIIVMKYCNSYDCDVQNYGVHYNIV